MKVALVVSGIALTLVGSLLLLSVLLGDASGGVAVLSVSLLGAGVAFLALSRSRVIKEAAA